MQARERHLQEELARARARLQAKPGLDDCAKATKEKADLELCQAAQSALTALAAEPATTPELALKRLAPAALALARLSQRVRYLSLSELGERRVEGAAPAPSASVGGTTAPARPTHVAKGKGSSHGEQRAFELGDGPVSQLLGLAIRSERDVLRNIGAYLEYGPLSVRRAAFDTTKRLRAEHPAWPALDHLLQEAAVLESNADLKGDLQRLSATASGSPRVARPDQSAGTK